MNKLKLLVMLLFLMLSNIKHVVAEVPKPAGWTPQYVNASCVVTTSVDSGEKNHPWTIRIGFMANQQLVFLYSFSQEKLKGLQIPKDLRAYLDVDGTLFEAMGISNQNGELVIPVENNIKLQQRLKSARSIGVKIKRSGADQLAEISNFTLQNIPGAMRWLDQCNLLGIRALQ